MSTLIVGAILTAISGAFAFLSGKRFERVVPVAVFSVIIVIYLFGLAHHMLYGFYAVLVLSGLAAGFCIFWLLRMKGEAIRQILTPGFAVFCFWMALVWWAHRGRIFANWDEFSHWGLVVKSMFITNDFGTAPEAIARHRTYPPGSSIFEWFWSKIAAPSQDPARFFESESYRAMHLFYMSLLLPLFDYFKGEKKRIIPALVFLCALLPVLLEDTAYTYIRVDNLLGVMILYFLITLYFSEKMDLFTSISLCASLFVMAIVKESGIGIAILLIVLVLCDIHIYKLKHVPILSMERLRALLFPALLVMSSLAGKLSWGLHMASRKIGEGRYSVRPGHIYALLTLDPTISASRTRTVSNFVDAFFSGSPFGNVIRFPALICFVLFFIMAFVIWKNESDTEKRQQYKVLFTTMPILCAVYIAYLLPMYVFIFQAEEAERLASYYRYVGTFLVGMLGFPLILLIKMGFEHYDKMKMTLAACLVSILLTCNLIPLMRITVLAPYSVALARQYRAPYAKINDIAPLLNPETDSVYLVAQEGVLSFMYHFQYNLDPIPIKSPGWANWGSGKTPETTGYFRTYMSMEEWEEILIQEGFTHMYLNDINDDFVERYHIMFSDMEEIVPDALYRIVVTDNQVHFVQC